MTQREAIAAWWREADEPTRRRALRLAEDDLLPEDMQRGLVKAGVTVVPLGRSGVDLGPLGYLQPDALVDFLADQR
ncbi:hypothetical protein AB2L27_19730 [Kineococcus sp. LSe6-4]|uniref:Acyl-CoA dehydrogenase n=1 Tax=Kineococcus halophytocola TaxID=3234027 RepID=A0ABV4H5X9_9ACTN